MEIGGVAEGGAGGVAVADDGVEELAIRKRVGRARVGDSGELAEEVRGDGKSARAASAGGNLAPVVGGGAGPAKLWSEAEVAGLLGRQYDAADLSELGGGGDARVVGGGGK